MRRCHFRARLRVDNCPLLIPWEGLNCLRAVQEQINNVNKHYCSVLGLLELAREHERRENTLEMFYCTFRGNTMHFGEKQL